ncbi:MAG: carbamate kinase [Burkholderiales bacterium PBB5]|nr:MAG: carbamate kinase [Burkholderiales bacterium PBB5]
MRLVVALGGNALLRRDQLPSAGNQLANVRIACAQVARVAAAHDLVLTHGNGPQVGLLALQSAAYTAVAPYPLDVLDAESAGMLGYLLELELANRLPAARAVASLLTRVQVDPLDPAFRVPTKPIGPVYTPAQADALARQRGWTVVADGGGWRRVVPSPRPVRVPGLEVIRTLLDRGVLVIAAGGGGIPVVPGPDGDGLHGVEAVIDKDLCSALIATDLQVDCLVIATDVNAVYLDWGRPTQRAIGRTTPQALAGQAFAAGSMAPKVEAACQFVRATGRRAAIGALGDIEALLAGQQGTQITTDAA